MRCGRHTEITRPPTTGLIAYRLQHYTAEPVDMPVPCRSQLAFGGHMKSRLLARWLGRLAVAALLISVSAAELHVMISAGFHGFYEELVPAFERAPASSSFATMLRVFARR